MPPLGLVHLFALVFCPARLILPFQPAAASCFLPLGLLRLQDFYNLVDVYLDAVLHPRCINDKRTFEQEGWHLELDDSSDPLTYKGVVFNEMKGVYSSPDSMFYRVVQQVGAKAGQCRGPPAGGYVLLGGPAPSPPPCVCIGCFWGEGVPCGMLKVHYGRAMRVRKCLTQELVRVCLGDAS